MSREELWVFQERNSPHLLGFRDLGSGCPPPGTDREDMEMWFPS